MDELFRNEKPSCLEKITAGLSGGVISLEYLLCFNNYDGMHVSASQVDRFRLLPIKGSYFGDVPEIFSAILASGFLANHIEQYGQKSNNRIVELFGKYFPAVTATVVGAYYTLGETVLPQILPGTPDVKDVPAVIVTAIASLFIANYARKQWKNSWKEQLTKLIRKADKVFNTDEKKSFVKE